MLGHSFKQLVFEQFFLEALPPPNPEPPAISPPPNDTEKAEQYANPPEPPKSWADEVEEELGGQQPEPIVVPVPASDGDNDDATKKDDVQVTEIPLPDEATPTATDVTLPESELDDYENEDDFEDLIGDLNADARQLSPSSEDNKKRLTPIPEESEPESSHEDTKKPVVDPEESDEPKGERQTEEQTTVFEQESPQTAPVDFTAPEAPVDPSPPQPGPESFPPLYVTADRSRVVTLPGGFLHSHYKLHVS